MAGVVGMAIDETATGAIETKREFSRDNRDLRTLGTLGLHLHLSLKRRGAVFARDAARARPTSFRPTTKPSGSEPWKVSNRPKQAGGGSVGDLPTYASSACLAVERLRGLPNYCPMVSMSGRDLGAGTVREMQGAKVKELRDFAHR